MPDRDHRDPILKLDLKLLGKFIYELNIARHHSISYPPAHPLVRASINRALNLLRQLSPENDTLCLGVTNGALWHGSTALDRKNPVFREFSIQLFSRGIALVTFQTSLTIRELDSFLRLLRKTRQEILDRGGLDRLIKEADLVHLDIRPIDYGRFRAVKTDLRVPCGADRAGKRSALLWERFVGDLLEEENAGSADNLPDDLLSPETLAELINDQAAPRKQKALGNYDQAITEFLREMDRERLSDEVCTPTLNRLKTLAASLNPELRLQLMNSTFRELGERPETADRVLRHFPENMLLDALEKLNARKEPVPPVVFKLLSRLSLHRSKQEIPAGARTTGAPFDLTAMGVETLFRPDRTAEFSTEEYHDMLQAMDRAAPHPPRDATSYPLDDEAFDSSIEKKTCDIIFELDACGLFPDEKGVRQKTLAQLWDHLLATGDFPALADIYRQQRDGRPGDDAAAAKLIREENLSNLHRKEALEDILDSLNHWGKERFPEIQNLVTTIGRPFVGPLLDRLAIESRRSLRYFLIDCLVELGEPAKEGILARLGDERWYYLRNLLTVLRRQGDPSVMAAALRLCRNPHDTVRQELLKTAVNLDDPSMDQLLLEDLAHPQLERRIRAIRLCRQSQNPQVFQTLLSILKRGGLDDANFQLKCATVDTLADMGSNESLAPLERLFLAPNILHPRRRAQLQNLILESLTRYPQGAASRLREQLGRRRGRGLTRFPGWVKKHFFRGEK